VVLDTPMEFYSALLDQSRNAKNRLVWSALYLGHGLMEKNLIDEVKLNSVKNSELKVYH
jgi:hypothetical protein